MTVKKESIRSVAAIEKGTVLDHIPAGSALPILEILDLSSAQMTATVGLSYPSTTMGKKDIIKVEGWLLSEDEIQKIALFAPQATVSQIDHFEVIKKSKVTLPKTVEGIIACPNPKCITNHDEGTRRFHVRSYRKKLFFTCAFCEREFPQSKVKKC